MSKKDQYAVILAGGVGTRFWPMSRANLPKQFLSITSSKSLLQETVLRIKSVIPPKNILIVTGKKYQSQISKQLSSYKVPKSNILCEPSGKNTAPAVCWAAAVIHKRNKNASMAILPSDHLIANRSKFLDVFKKAFKLANNNYLVTLGLVPTRPETGYGYLQTRKVKVSGKNILKVSKFTEKPTLPKAKQFIKKKNYFWNSGMFVWRADVILNEFKTHLPDHYKHFTAKKDVTRQWSKLKPVSVDYGILEKAENVVAVPAAGINWSDLGSWESLYDVLDKDKKGNHKKGKAIVVNCKDTMVVADKRQVATIGLDNIVVIDTPDAILITRKDLSQDVRLVVEQLKKQGDTTLL